MTEDYSWVEEYGMTTTCQICGETEDQSGTEYVSPERMARFEAAMALIGCTVADLTVTRCCYGFEECGQKIHACSRCAFASPEVRDSRRPQS